MQPVHSKILTATCILLSLSAGLAQKVPGAGQQQQAGQSQNQSQIPAGNQPSASSPNSGLTWPRDTWDDLTTIKKKNIYPKDTPIFKLCYELDVTTGSLTTPPFVFTQVDTIQGDTDATACIKQVDSRHPLMMRGLLVVAVDARRVPTDRMRSITMNLTTQQGSPIYPNPIRPSPGGASTAPGAGPGGGAPGARVQLPKWGKIYYLVWPQQLQGDVIPTVSLSLAYTPPAPGTEWTPETVYPEGSVVTPKTDDGHYYTARRGGISGSDANGPVFQPAPTIKDPDNNGVLGAGGVEWVDSGTTQPSNAPAAGGSQVSQAGLGQQPCCCPPAAPAAQGATTLQTCPVQQTAPTQQGGPIQGSGGPPGKQLPVPTWAAKDAYKEGDVIFVPANGHYYTAIHDGTSGAMRPAFLANKQFLIPDAMPTLPDSVPDRMMGRDREAHTVPWKLKAEITADPPCSLPSDLEPPSAFPDWQKGKSYASGNCIQDPTTKAYFQLTPSNPPGPGPFTSLLQGRPLFSSVGVQPQQIPPIQWEDSGTSPPTLVASGQPADQTISQTYQLPQVHSKYYFNLASGAIVSTVHSQSFGWETITQPSGSGATAQPGSYMAIRTGGSVIVDPVLFFSAYLWPMDAESTWQKSNLRPALTFGLSLSAPASNFYFGLSSEFRRNIQVVYGFTVAQQAKLAPGLYQPTNPAPGKCQANCSTSNATPPPTVQTFKPGGFIGISYNITGFIQSLFGGGGSKGSSQ